MTRRAPSRPRSAGWLCQGPRGLIVAVIAAVLAIGAACGEDEANEARAEANEARGAATPRVDRFDEARAWALLRRQVALGPRPAGSPTLRRLSAELARMLPQGRVEAVPGHRGLRNVVGRIAGSKPAILVGAHHDTKDIPGFVGANDAAGGTAMVVEVARSLRRIRRPAGAPEIRFVLFDGEEATDDDRFYETGLRGSKAYARRHAKNIKAMVLVDFVAEKNIRIPREASSDPALWRQLRAAARRVGALEAFPDAEQGVILDDHTPFIRRGVPAIDLIDFDFPCWHQTCDDLDVVSERSLDLVGETVVELVRGLR